MPTEKTNEKDSPSQDGMVEVLGARVHNLKNIDVRFPRNKLVVLTGLSGSGKSSLAFDTIYAEGQRRYIESFSAYARQFLGTLERPDVDKITGLSPVISIEQKTTNKSPRSTVGTITEIYDFLRLLYARVGEAYSYVTNEKMVRFTDDQIINKILKEFDKEVIAFLAPVVKGRKGHYRELFEQYRKQGYLKVRVDGEIKEIEPGMIVERYQTHDIEIVIDHVEVNKNSRPRLFESMQLAMKIGKGVIMILPITESNAKKKEQPIFFSRNLMCPTSGIAYDDPAPNTFSFNSPYGACPECKGIGKIKEINEEAVFPEPNKTIAEGGIAPLNTIKNQIIYKQIESIARKFDFDLNILIKKIPREAKNLILYGSEEKISVPFEFNGNTNKDYEIRFEGISNLLLRLYDEGTTYTFWINEYLQETTCAKCNGSRLKQESLYYKLDGKNIGEISDMDIGQLRDWFDNLESNLSERQNIIAKDILKEIRSRIKFITDVGLDYLTLNRSSKSLSGGEAQRIRLATQIGSQLVGVHYILDEPSVGLHYRDNKRLIGALQNLRNLGNSVLVVEHDKEMIEQADYVLDLGPGAGRKGGKVVAYGNPKEILAFDTVTSNYLNGKLKINVPSKRRNGSGKCLKLIGARGNNLKNIAVEFPLGKFICVTGVSGSGKSSLINQTLYPVLAQRIYKSRKIALPYKKTEGLEHIDKVIEIDQSPIGRTPRSNPATYTGVFTEIRNIFTQLPEAKIRGYKPGRFSFNVQGGRCETCKGAGIRIIEMNLLPNVHVHCETCQGNRYNRETLEVRYKGKSINDVLNMSINQAVDFFENIPKIYRILKTLQDVGMGYVSVGQQSTTLSGGEAQRIKLSSELSKRDTGKTFYILDEPTTGLHFEDIKVLLGVLNKLVDKGNTVLVIEHNMDVIKVSDHVIDLGPNGGENGGQVICEGTPEEVSKVRESFTGEILKSELTRYSLN